MYVACSPRWNELQHISQPSQSIITSIYNFISPSSTSRETAPSKSSRTRGAVCHSIRQWKLSGSGAVRFNLIINGNSNHIECAWSGWQVTANGNNNLKSTRETQLRIGFNGNHNRLRNDLVAAQGSSSKMTPTTARSKFNHSNLNTSDNHNSMVDGANRS